MAEWTRLTPWRQGCILDRETLDALSQSDPPLAQGRDVAIVISHDCDVAAKPATEPVVEVIGGKLLHKHEVDGSLTHAKDPRRLHLPVTTSETSSVLFAEFNAKEKETIPKSQLADYTPCSKFSITPQELGILRRWLAARYRRHAFSDAFETRFDKVEGKLREILKKSTSHLRAVLFDLDEEQQPDELNADIVYILDIYLVYTSQSDPVDSLRVAKEAKTKIERAFAKQYKDGGRWTDIELRSCEVISDSALTYFQYLQLAEWRSESMSLKSDPPGPMTEENS
jgi:hypothetical protein